MKNQDLGTLDSKGGLKDLALLFLPLLLITFSNYLFLLVEKVFLTKFSPSAMEAAINTAYVCQIFQGATLAVATMSQVFVGKCFGAGQFRSIGPGIWQFIWFSFLSMTITVPISLFYGMWYFQGTDIESVALPYFYFLVAFNFLFPLSAVLSCFFIGRGRTRIVLICNLGLQIFKICLAYILIFGVENWFAPQGIMGGAISTVMAQGIFCVLLGFIFINKEHRSLFATDYWRFQKPLFWECIYPGILRASSRILGFTSWASIAHLMITKGGDYLLILSIGGSLSLFLPFLCEAICQAQTTIVSQFLGANNFIGILKARRSGYILVLFMILIASIPFLVCPSLTFHWLFKGVVLDTVIMQKVFFGVWLSFAFFTLSAIPLSYIFAYKDMKFLFLMGAANWVNGYLLMYFFIEMIHIEADQFWSTLCLMHLSIFLIYIWRVRYLLRRSINESQILNSL